LYFALSRLGPDLDLDLDLYPCLGLYLYPIGRRSSSVPYPCHSAAAAVAAFAYQLRPFL